MAAGKISKLSINQNNLNLGLLVHHKFQKKIQKKSQETVCKFELEEGQYFNITYGRIKPTNINFSLATSKYNIEMANPKICQKNS
jgi:hypothetical protein